MRITIIVLINIWRFNCHIITFISVYTAVKNCGSTESIPWVFSEICDLGYLSTELVNTTLDACIDSTQILGCFKIYLRNRQVVNNKVEFYRHLNKASADNKLETQKKIIELIQSGFSKVRSYSIEKDCALNRGFNKFSFYTGRV
jgi:hypothetical protein